MPELPRVYLDTTYALPGGATYTPADSAAFAAAVTAAALGDVIVLAAGTTYTGPFTLPNKGAGASWIYIISSALASLPAPGVRVGPANVGAMARITGASESLLVAASGAHHYRFVGIEVQPSAYVTNIIDLDTADHITIDRCYIHGHATAGSRRGAMLNGTSLAVIDSYVSECMEVGADSQALAGWNGAGPFKIVNNYLEGAGENVMFGGSESSSADNIPSDIEIRRNHLNKPLTWRVGDPSYAGTHWTVKNLLEFKDARRVLVEGNLIEQCWIDGQNGTAIVFTPRNDAGGAPWQTVEDVIFRSNIVRKCGGGFTVLGTDGTFSSQDAARILLSNNLWYEIDSAVWGGDGRWGLYVITPDAPVSFEAIHNTVFANLAAVYLSGSPEAPGFVMRDNILGTGVLGLVGDGVGGGNTALNFYCADPYVATPNVFVDNGYDGSFPPGNYPVGTLFAVSIAAVEFVDVAGGTYTLLPSSPYYRAASDWTDFGIDGQALAEAMSGAPTRRGGAFFGQIFSTRY